MPREVKVREPEDWLDELRRLARIGAAARIDPVRSERWKQTVCGFVDALSILVTVTPGGEEEAISTARQRIARELGL